MNPRAERLKLGAEAESLAMHYLTARGLKLKTQNYRSRWGEIDLIMDDDKTLVFVEVRYRSRSDFGSAADSIDQRKQQRIARTALSYAQEHSLHNDIAMRFDVVLIENDDKHTHHNNAKIDWIKDAFDADID
ncbi:YraN family protein [Gammaproteobacteria bacterium AH-315-C21]|nr:YraN family protein [Gammaproteobacteria bacterium AH-315-C21]